MSLRVEQRRMLLRVARSAEFIPQDRRLVKRALSFPVRVHCLSVLRNKFRAPAPLVESPRGGSPIRFQSRLLLPAYDPCSG